MLLRSRPYLPDGTVGPWETHDPATIADDGEIDPTWPDDVKAFAAKVFAAFRPDAAWERVPGWARPVFFGGAGTPPSPKPPAAGPVVPLASPQDVALTLFDMAPAPEKTKASRKKNAKKKSVDRPQGA